MNQDQLPPDTTDGAPYLFVVWGAVAASGLLTLWALASLLKLVGGVL